MVVLIKNGGAWKCLLQWQSEHAELGHQKKSKKDSRSSHHLRVPRTPHQHELQHKEGKGKVSLCHVIIVAQIV